MRETESGEGEGLQGREGGGMGGKDRPQMPSRMLAEPILEPRPLVPKPPDPLY